MSAEPLPIQSQTDGVNPADAAAPDRDDDLFARVDALLGELGAAMDRLEADDATPVITSDALAENAVLSDGGVAEGVEVAPEPAEIPKPEPAPVASDEPPADQASETAERAAADDPENEAVETPEPDASEVFQTAAPEADEVSVPLPEEGGVSETDEEAEAIPAESRAAEPEAMQDLDSLLSGEFDGLEGEMTDGQTGEAVEGDFVAPAREPEETLSASEPAAESDVEADLDRDEEADAPAADTSTEEIESVLAAAAEAGPVERVEPESPAGIEELDAALGAADEESFDDAVDEQLDAPVLDAEPVAAFDASPAASDTPVEPAEPESLPEPATEAAPMPEPEPEPAAEPVAASGSVLSMYGRPPAIPAGATRFERGRKWAWHLAKWFGPPTWTLTRRAGVTVGRAAEPYAAKALDLCGKPLSGKPALVRSAIGWVGAYTAFLGVCVWAYLLLFRQPAVPEVTPEAVLVEPAEIMQVTAATTDFEG